MFMDIIIVGLDAMNQIRIKKSPQYGAQGCSLVVNDVSGPNPSSQQRQKHRVISFHLSKRIELADICAGGS